MTIKLTKNTGRRCAWTDRKNGYFEFSYGEKSENNGYYRTNRKYFKNITSGGHPLMDAKSIEVKPEGLTADFDGEKLNFSLLIDEQAVYISGAKNPGLTGIISGIKTSQEDAEKLAALEAQKKAAVDNPLLAVAPNDQVRSAYGSSAIEWKNLTIDGITVLSGSAGIAAASSEYFYSRTDDDVLSFNSDSKSGIYIVFEDSKEKAVEKAVRLVKENGFKNHCDKISAFLEKTKIETGDKKFDEAVMWARFSGWLLAARDHDSYRGIWAGLPWFRDNWGRDTFISMNGTLLSSGCFEEAENVLMGFAGFQDRNKESPSYGRIPNRYRDANDVIYNTIDGTLWFIRALFEYVDYSGNTKILEKLSETVETALDAESKRCDSHGFLKHGDADTWMDARIMGDHPWSPRGDRANDIQALWFNALKLGAKLMKHLGKNDKAETYSKLAEKVKESFTEFFWNTDCDAFADHLPEGGYGEWAKDMRVRPNQLFSITAPQNEKFISDEKALKILENVDRELVNPFGLYSLTPEDPTFHPEHENPELYNKDAAYHNGTIWEWNSGPYISACAKYSDGLLSEKASSILKNEARMILEAGCAGSLSENIHANPDEDGNPKLSGTFSQAWSVAEFVRNVTQDAAGFLPHLSENEIFLNPCFPNGLNELKASFTFGNNWKLNAEILRKNSRYEISVLWDSNGDTNLPSLKINGEKFTAGKKLSLKTKCRKDISVEKFGVPSKWITDGFAGHDLFTEWNGSIHGKDYLEKVILSGRLYSKTSGGEHTGALEWFFDSKEFKEKYVTDIELGAVWTKTATTFRLWAPTARSVTLVLYSKGNGASASKKIPMTKLTEKGSLGVWETVVEGNLDGTYYEYETLIYGVKNHCADPYAKACGVNGQLSMVLDFSKTNPKGWNEVKPPVLKNPSDAVVYEAHIRDISSSESWNGSNKNRCTFKGACESGTSVNGVPTGFDHIKALGVTHVQLLPVFDFRSVDESRVHEKDYINKPNFGAFNWGYDPENYGCLEGSYSSDPYNGEVRVKEFKELVKTYAENGIGVIMDVVFNHVNDGPHQSLGISVPGYFFRVEGYSGAGEDTASEREMFRKYMVNMLSWWLSEYKLCGFRFDLMGLHDVDTMNEIVKALKKIKGDVLVYGEGWNMYNAGKMISACQNNAAKMPSVGHFNDAIRCAVKGTIQNDTEPGFIHNGNRREALKFGITGATNHPQVDFSKVEGTGYPHPWTDKTWTSINYTEIHDNITLNDKLHMVEENKPDEYYVQLGKMALSLVLLSEGLPILHAGMEFLRTKEMPEDIKSSGAVFYEVAVSKDGNTKYLKNSYNACDRINGLDWNRAFKNRELVEYVKKLIQFRKEHIALRLPDGSDVAKYLSFTDNMKAGLPEPVLAWEINSEKVRDSFKKIFIAANPLVTDVKVNLPEGDWFCVTDGISFEEFHCGSSATIRPKTVAVFAVK